MLVTPNKVGKVGTPHHFRKVSVLVQSTSITCRLTSFIFRVRVTGIVAGPPLGPCIHAFCASKINMPRLIFKSWVGYRHARRPTTLGVISSRLAAPEDAISIQKYVPVASSTLMQTSQETGTPNLRVRTVQLRDHAMDTTYATQECQSRTSPNYSKKSHSHRPRAKLRD